MYRLALLLPVAMTGQAAEPVDRLLAGVEQQYRTASSFHLIATYRSRPWSPDRVRNISWDSEGAGHVRLTLSGIRLESGYAERTIPSAWAEVGGYHYQDAIDWRVRVIADGSTAWTENAVTHRYDSRELCSFAAHEIAGELFTMFIARYRNISSRVIAPRIAGHASIAGVHCVIVETVDAVRRRYWIDEKTHLVRKEEARDGKNRWSVTFAAAETGRSFAAGTFRFDLARRAVRSPVRGVVPVSSPLPDYW